MSKSKNGRCGCRNRIVSSTVQKLQQGCTDVCVTPQCGSPEVLSLMAPLIYDEIGINLCATFPVGEDLLTTYPTAVCGALYVLDVVYTYGTEPGTVSVEAITGRPNCYAVILSGLTVQLALALYDDAGRLLATLYPEALFLPADPDADTYDEDMNPSSVVLEVFAPYGVAYTPGVDATADPTPVLNVLGFLETNNYVRQGLNLYAMPKLLNLDLEESEITVGLTLILQSLYFAGYRVATEGKILTPKGSLVAPDESDCMRFVTGDLLNLAIKPLNLGIPSCGDADKIPCGSDNACTTCVGNNNGGGTVITETTPAPAAFVEL